MAIQLQKNSKIISQPLRKCNFVNNMLKSFCYSKGPTSFTIKSEVSELYLEAPTSDNFPHLAVSAVHYTVLQWLTVRLKADIFIIATTQHLSSLLSSFTLLYPNVKLHNDNYCQSTKYTVSCHQTVTSLLLSGS